MTSDWTELDLIKLFSSAVKDESDGLCIGIGDDCAVIRPESESDFLVTTDMLVEDVHFNLSWHPPMLLGRKCIAVSLSDIAAMGGDPKFVFISLSVPDHISRDWLEEWSKGVHSIVRNYGCVLAGGDTVRGPVLTINATVIGKIIKNRGITRKNAKKGENIYVSGPLGSAAAGLRIFSSGEERGMRTLYKAEPFKMQHLSPEPEVALGKLLSKSGLVTSMQDLSDGLATDLAHICSASGVNAEVEECLLPCLPDLPEMCRHLDALPVDLQVSGGEDYRLLFTVEKNRDKDLLLLLGEQGFDEIYRIGVICPGEGKVLLLSDDGGVKDITFRGFEHKGS